MKQPGELLATGRTAEIYAWDEGRVIKLFRQGWDRYEAELEMSMTQRVREVGFNAPRIDELVRVKRRDGFIAERIDGREMLTVMLEQPERIAECARISAELHAQMHNCRAIGFFSQRQKLVHKIRNAAPLTQPVRQEIIRRLHTLPDDFAVCHGDFHPANILLTDNGARVIDWVDTTVGSALADVARTTMILENLLLMDDSALPPEIRAVRDGIRQFVDLYLARYAELRRFDPDLLTAWRLPVAAARLVERIPPEVPILVSEIEAALG